MRWLAVMLGILVLAACAGEPASPPPVIPRPPLERFDPAIRAQIEQARSQLATALADPASDPPRRAASWGDLGVTFHAYELVGAARECYRQAGALAPRDPRWPYLLGRLERSLGEPAAAIRELRRAVVLDPARAVAWVALGETLLEQAQPEQARPAFQTALERSPVCPPAEVGLAKIALGEDRLEEARDRLLAALRGQPEADAIHHHLARVYRRLGELTEAERHLRSAGARQPALPDPWLEHVEEHRLGTHNLMTQAQRATRTGRLEEAIEIYHRILAAEPGHVRAWINLGAALARQERLEEAQTALERAVELAPGDPLARFNLGTVRLQRGDPRAAAELEASLAADPRQPAARLNLATAHRLAGRHEQALAQYDALLELAAASPTARYWRALTQLRLGRHPKARAGLEEGLRITPRSPLLRATLARLLASSREPAVRDGERALALARELATAAPSWEHRRTLAMALAETGSYAAAGEEQRRALALARERGVPAAVLAELESELRGYAARRPARLGWWLPVEAAGRFGNEDSASGVDRPDRLR